jgi:DNA-binding MarR family transcriptional regulator
MNASDYLIVPLLQAFCWFDDGLQAHLQANGWAHVTRPQSMVMVNIVTGVRRPSDIARNLGVSRQAIHSTIAQMVDMGMLALEDDPLDGRSKIVAIAPKGQAMRADAIEAVRALTAELARRIGKSHVANLAAALAADWGAPLVPDAPSEGNGRAKGRKKGFAVAA